MMIRLFSALRFAAVAGMAGVFAAGVPAPAPAEERNADALLIVDCLLPGQVRKLGRMRQFLTARRPIQTTAADCEIRGGEYTAYDRASYASALKVWLPRAEQGDPAAQTHVGEIYEKGLGLAPDYGAAAEWYRRAAEAGFSRAQINLGHLYEKGLGVARDPKQALAWYRRASGLQDAVILDPGTLNAERAELAALRDEVAERRQESEQLKAQLEQTRRQLDRARRELGERRQRLESERTSLSRARDELARQKREAERANDASEVARAERRLREREQELADREREIGRLNEEIGRVEGESKRYRQQLAELSDKDRELASLKSEVEKRRAEANRVNRQLEATRSQLAAARQDLDRQRGALTDRERRLADSRAALERARREKSAGEAELAKRAEELAGREAELERERVEMTRLRAEVGRVQDVAEQYQSRLAALESERAARPEPATPPVVALVGPEIELIDPVLRRTRGEPVIKLRSGVLKRQVTGRVTAPAGLLTLVINDLPAKPNPLGVFQTDVAITATRTPVTIVAVDQQGKRSTLEFVLASETRQADGRPAAPSPADAPAPARKLPRVRFGTYHALVIGNNRYTHLPELDTAVNDAKAVAAVLEKKYGFKTTLLLDADRYALLSAMNELRKTLTKDDNLLIYYAGHGELDKVNMRGHWLPVDAEPESSANWISNVSITDTLNVIAAKQILLVADSCYSGALTRSALTRLDTGMTEDERFNWIKVMAKKRSRTVLTSGGLKPVLDGGGGQNSVFAKAFLEVLETNDGVLEGRRLYQEIAARVAYAASTVRFEQVPEYAPIKHAGHEGGDFFIVPRS